ncbi:MAG: hypothetical protein M3Z54_13750 [Gemmatimonadota bacterium]|nr:hypothetical protein [Gemmatimonadota bacterium]
MKSVDQAVAKERGLPAARVWRWIVWYFSTTIGMSVAFMVLRFAAVRFLGLERLVAGALAFSLVAGVFGFRVGRYQERETVGESVRLGALMALVGGLSGFFVTLFNTP